MNCLSSKLELNWLGYGRRRAVLVEGCLYGLITQESTLIYMDFVLDMGQPGCGKAKAKAKALLIRDRSRPPVRLGGASGHPRTIMLRALAHIHACY